MTQEDQLAEEFGYWNEHPRFPLSTWQEEVSNDDTRRSYWAWCVVQEECEVLNQEDVNREEPSDEN